MNNVCRALLPASMIIVGLLIFFKVGIGAGVTPVCGGREFIGAFLIVVGILAEILVWTRLWVK